MKAARRALWLWLALSAPACAKPGVAQPDDVIRAYQMAAQRGDADAIYRLLSKRSQRELGPARTRALVADARKELADWAQRLSKTAPRPEAVAVIRFDDGETSELTLEDHVFKVGAALALPALARTPAEALSELRRALARRSYPALVRVLSAETRAALEHNLAAMVEGLEEPDTLDLDVEGDSAEVALPGGHVVKLKRESGFWKIEDFR